MLKQTLILGSVSCITILSPRFQGRNWRLFRTTIFVGTGLSSLAPITHATLIFGVSEMLERSGLPYYLSGGLLYITGVVFYAVSISKLSVVVPLSPANGSGECAICHGLPHSFSSYEANILTWLHDPTGSRLLSTLGRV